MSFIGGRVFPRICYQHLKARQRALSRPFSPLPRIIFILHLMNRGSHVLSALQSREALTPDGKFNLCCTVLNFNVL